MTRYAAFLRGVNVGGVNLKMAEVAAALADAGFKNVRTILASGNVLLESPRRHRTRAQDGRGGAARRLRLRRVGAGLRHGHRGGRSPTAYPFEREVPDTHSLRHVRVRSRRPRRTGRTAAPVQTNESSAATASSIGKCRDRSTLDSAMGKTMGKKRYKSSTTTRNLRTIDKVLRR